MKIPQPRVASLCSLLRPLSRAAVLAAALLADASVATFAQPVSVLHTFTRERESQDGGGVEALAVGDDGTLYGMTYYSFGNVSKFFRIAPGGTGLQIIYNTSVGAIRSSGVKQFIRGRDGTLFVILAGSVASINPFSLCRINPDGTGFAVIHTFATTSDPVGRDGAFPTTLMQGSDGNLYGTTLVGSGSSTSRDDDNGTIWRCAPDGSGYRVIFSFNGGTARPNGFNALGLIQGSDGNLYGNTASGGARGGGTIFTLKTDGTGFTVLRSLYPAVRPPTEAGYSQTPLVEGADGLLYGTGTIDGADNQGSVFKMRRDGSGYETIHSFRPASAGTGFQPQGAFFQGRDGYLYGTASDVYYKIRPDGTGYTVVARPGATYRNLVQGPDEALYGVVSATEPTTGLRTSQLVRIGEVRAIPIAITQQPRSQTVAPGGSVTFTVVASGASSYQWRRNGTAIAGATGSSYTLNSLTTANAGDYSVIASNATTSAVSDAAVLLVATPIPGRLINLSVRTTAGSGAQTLIAGFVVGGTGSKQVLVRAIGPTLTAFGVTGALADPQLGLFNASSTQIATNTGWGGGAPLANAFASVGAFALTASARDSALLSPLAPGGYSAQVVSAAGGTGVALVEAYDADGATSTARFVNLSARTVAGTGAQTLIAGFVLSGNVPKTLLIRGVGPGLNQFGLTGTLANPRLELHTTVNGTDVTVATNTGWGGTPALTAAFAQVGAFNLPATSADAVLMVSLEPGSYTAQVSGVGGTTGIALVEVYEVP